MTDAQARRLRALRLCDLYAPEDGVRYRPLWDGVDIFAVERGDRLYLQANVYPFMSITRPYTGWGLAECKEFVRRCECDREN